MSLPRIHLVIGPGTLHSRGHDRMDFANYRKSGKPRMTGQELLAELPEIAKIANVTVDPGNPHEVTTLEEIRRLAHHVNELTQRADVDGVVFVQGTNVLEETAYMLTLTVKSAKPVVVTGAQRPFTALSADAALNLYDAFRVAACADTHGKGVVVATNGEINAARDVTKTNTYHVHTFRSRDVGMLGYADPDRIVYYRAPLQRHTVNSEFSADLNVPLPRVELMGLYAGSQAGMAEAAVKLGAKGLVIAGIGAGAMGTLTDECMKIAAERRAVVVRSARVGEGRVFVDSAYHEPNFIAAGNLLPQKAALLLSLALTRTADLAEIQRIFDQY
ncbi:MAG: asparaginase [Betaproteobacteria bacterium]|nr:asparaginase [Betaproteobacteria bacterium]